MEKFGSLYLDLKKVNAIEFHGGASSITIYIGSSVIYYGPDFKDSDSADDTYETICERRHKELVLAVINAKSKKQ